MLQPMSSPEAQFARSSPIQPDGANAGATSSLNKEIRILFVCTGNTCRSPMAEAIALDLLMRSPPKGVRIHVDSAGTGADVGALPSAETAAALESVGAEPSRHRSQQVTRDMIDRASAVYAMTTTHRRALLSLAPDQSHKIHLLDPAGKDVADPIGRGAEVYRHTAAALRDMVSQRLKEVLAGSTGSTGGT